MGNRGNWMGTEFRVAAALAVAMAGCGQISEYAQPHPSQNQGQQAPGQNPGLVYPQNSPVGSGEALGPCSKRLREDSKEYAEDGRQIDEKLKVARTTEKAIEAINEGSDRCNEFVDSYGIDFACIAPETGKIFRMADFQAYCQREVRRKTKSIMKQQTPAPSENDGQCEDGSCRMPRVKPVEPYRA